MKLTPSKIAMLQSVRDHGNGFHHVRGNSQFGGCGQTMYSLKRAGFALFSVKELDGGDCLTDAGRAALEAHEARLKKSTP